MVVGQTKLTSNYSSTSSPSYSAGQNTTFSFSRSEGSLTNSGVDDVNANSLHPHPASNGMRVPCESEG